MKNGKSVLKFLGIVFLIIGIAGGITGFLLALFVPGVLLFGIIFGGVLTLFALAGSICLIIYAMTDSRNLLQKGKYVYAEIVDIDVKVNQQIHVDRITMNPYYIICKYTTPDGTEYFFKSKSLLYNPSALVQDKQLKVYVDLEKPRKYYVDTSSILPDDAVLHKFKFDSTSNAERLIKEGQYIEAVTCGVELIGRIKVNSVVKPMYLKLTPGIAEQFQIATDDKNRVFIGYVVLCRYQAPDGTIHIFASKGRLGEPDREYKGETVKVYYSGDGFKYYHVALPEMSKQDGIL